MEEIYIIKLKGLPSSSQESLRDNKASFYYHKDLTGEALLGFGTLHTIIGSTLIILSIVNLFLYENKSEILGTGVWCGAIFVFAGLMGIVTAHKRKSDISKSKIQVKIFFVLSLVTLILTSIYFMFLIFDIKEPTFNQYIGNNILLSFIFELLTSLLSIFTCIRVIWPGSIACCAKDWPMHPKLKRKVIVSTQIYTNGVKQDEDLIRNLGPNCVISLSPPQVETISRSDNYLVDNDRNDFESMCDCCDHHFNNTSNIDCNSVECHHNLRTESSHSENHEQYESDFDVDNFDSIVEHEISDIKDEELQEIDFRIEENISYSNDENCRNETICRKELSVENVSQSHELHNQIINKSTDEELTETSCEKPDQCLAIV